MDAGDDAAAAGEMAGLDALDDAEAVDGAEAADAGNAGTGVPEEPEWLAIMAYENLPGCPPPMFAVCA
jgi:hypothetical protein